MRKRIINPVAENAFTFNEEWLDIAAIAEAELTSEDPAHPIEHALVFYEGTGWKAGEPGGQTIWLRFDPPRHIRQIRLRFTESEVDRTQEYGLRWLQEGGDSVQEIVRQQWNFSRHGSNEAIGDHVVNLPKVSMLELLVDPDINRADVYATLAELRLA